MRSLAVVCLLAATANAKPTKKQLVAIGSGAIVYLAAETVLKSRIAPETCSWCAPPSFDAAIRDRLRWSDTEAAGQYSSFTGFLLVPALAGVVALHGSEPLDDLAQLAGSGVAAMLVTEGFKLTVGRARPFVYYGDPSRPHQTDDDVSFSSGHTAFAFSLATSAGVLAHRHRDRFEPAIWAVGFALAAATGYLRIAADEHYFSDVAAGALIGVACGLTVPSMMQHGDVEVVPLGMGVAIAGRF